MMKIRVVAVAGLALMLLLHATPKAAEACCPAPPPGKPVVNADQAVILMWDPATKTEHFIRRATFKSAADDFGFLVPTPNEPELAESGDDAFPFLLKVTEPEIIKERRPSEGCGCLRSAAKSAGGRGEPTKHGPSVEVLQEKTVAGFHAVVLETKSATALVGWLKEHNYEMSPAIEAWAKPYVDQGWKITALKVAKDKASSTTDNPKVAAASLRMSFKTDRPLFPYREPLPPPGSTISERTLRIYFIGESRYDGELTPDNAWKRQVVWSNKLTTEQRAKTLDLLKLSDAAHPKPSSFWLTEFEDAWAQLPPSQADLYFSPSKDQSVVKRPPIIEYIGATDSKSSSDVSFALVVLAPLTVRWLRRRRSSSQKP